MKKSILTLFGIIFFTVALCQENESEFKTIFGNQHMSVSGFGGFDMHFSYIGNGYSFGAGGSGGVLLSGQVFFGGFGMGSTIDKTIKFDNITINQANIGYGGLMFGYIFNGKKAIHPALFLQTGWGGIDFDEYNNATFGNYSSDNIFVLNPSIEMEMNIARFFRLAIGANYQITTGVNEYYNLSNSDFSGPGGKIAFRFGWF